MGNLLFSPKGRIGPSEAIKGLIILGVLAGLIHLAMLKGAMVGGLAVLFGLLILLYPLLAVLIKRCHDAGKSGWMALLFVVLAIVIYSVLGMIAEGFIATDLKTNFEAALLDIKGSTDPNETLAVMTEYGDPYAAATAIPSAAIAFLTFLITGFLANLVLKSDPDTNQYD